MIKLEELKKGDIIYAISYDKEIRHVCIYADIKVEHELCTIDIIPPIYGVICSGGTEILSRNDEPYLFRTEEDRNIELKRLRREIIQNFENDTFLKNKLFKKATTKDRLDKYYTDLFKEILGIN